MGLPTLSYNTYIHLLESNMTAKECRWHVEGAKTLRCCSRTYIKKQGWNGSVRYTWWEAALTRYSRCRFQRTLYDEGESILVYWKAAAYIQFYAAWKTKRITVLNTFNTPKSSGHSIRMFRRAYNNLSETNPSRVPCPATKWRCCLVKHLNFTNGLSEPFSTLSAKAKQKRDKIEFGR